MDVAPAQRDFRAAPRARLFWKLLLSFAALSAATVAALVALGSTASRLLLERQLDDRLRAIAVAVGEPMRTDWPTHGDDAVQQRVGHASRRLGVRLTVIDSSGRVLADSSQADRAAVDTMENHRDRPEFIDARRTGEGVRSRISPTTSDRTHYLAIRIDAPDGKPLGVVRASLSTKEMAAQAAAFTRRATAIGLAAVLATWTLAYVALARLTAPLQSLVTAADAMVAGQFDQRLPVTATGADEIGVLVRALGEVRDRVAHGEQRLRSTSQTQATVLEGMTESVIAVDRHERILFANAAASRSLGLNSRPVEGLTLMEAVRSHELRGVMQQALRTQRPSNCELDWRVAGRRTFDVLAAPLPGEPPPGVVLVLRDVTELKRLEQMRQQFIANVSHELKTPLSSIKAYTETLQGGASRNPEHCDRFLARIDEQATRLHEIIQDMLSLARIEAGQAALEIVDIPLARVVRRSIADHEPQAIAAEIVLENQAADAELKVRADEEGVRQILSNLIDNAVKYTPAGGRVVVCCRPEGAMAVIEVADTGVGIAPEHHSRLFERFYRVDRARSRELGGTGLGLSIVKHLCLAMGGRVSVRSQPRHGSTFEVRLPLAAGAPADDGESP